MPPSERHLQMVFICPLLQHLPCCRHSLFSQILGKIPQMSSPVKAFASRTGPGAPLLQEARQQHGVMKSIQLILFTGKKKISFLFIFNHFVHIIQNFAHLSYSPLVVFSRLNKSRLLNFSLQHSCSISP